MPHHRREFVRVDERIEQDGRHEQRRRQAPGRDRAIRRLDTYVGVTRKERVAREAAVLAVLRQEEPSSVKIAL